MPTHHPRRTRNGQKADCLHVVGQRKQTTGFQALVYLSVISDFMAVEFGCLFDPPYEYAYG